MCSLFGSVSESRLKRSALIQSTPNGAATYSRMQGPGNMGGDLYKMISNFNINPYTKHYIYHEGAKSLIYYNHLTAVGKNKTQNTRGRSIGVMNSASQMRRTIIGR